MATDHTLPVRVALLALLSADAVMKTLVGDSARVYDHVPSGTSFPYVRIGDDLVRDYGDKTDAEQELELTLHVFDQTPANRGQKTINLIQARIYELLHEQAVLGAYLVRFITQHTTNEDGKSWHGVSRYRVLI